MFKQWYPGVHYDSVYAIDFLKYYETGYRAVLFDIDNTLVMHDAPANEQAAEFFAYLKRIGFQTCLISNNDDARVAPFAEIVGAEYICNASKPKADGFLKAMKQLGVTKEQTMMVGDQLFTDIWGANNAGILAVHTEQIARDPLFHIRLKRSGEKIVMIFYRLYLRNHPQQQYLK